LMSLAISLASASSLDCSIALLLFRD